MIRLVLLHQSQSLSNWHVFPTPSSNGSLSLSRSWLSTRFLVSNIPLFSNSPNLIPQSSISSLSPPHTFLRHILPSHTSSQTFMGGFNPNFTISGTYPQVVFELWQRFSGLDERFNMWQPTATLFCCVSEGAKQRWVVYSTVSMYNLAIKKPVLQSQLLPGSA
jgi:hypothetical protein